MINFITNKENCIKTPALPDYISVRPVGAVSILGFTHENSLNINESFSEEGEMELLLNGRRSTRRFKRENIDKKEIVNLVNTATCSPTGCNAMSVCFTVIDEYKKMEFFRDLAMEKFRVIVSE